MTRVPFTQNHRWHLPLLLLVFCCSFFINNGAIFADIMESRNIITAREMVYDHNWLVPTMNGELRLKKPDCCHSLMGAIYYLYLALRQNPCKWTYFIGAGIFMGLSFLGKGPVSFYALLLPFVCAYILYYRKETQMKGKWIALAVMILIGIVLSTWWYAYIYIYHQRDGFLRVSQRVFFLE